MAVVILDGWQKLFDVLLLNFKLCTRKPPRLVNLGYSAKDHSKNTKFNRNPLPNLPDDQKNRKTKQVSSGQSP